MEHPLSCISIILALLFSNAYTHYDSLLLPINAHISFTTNQQFLGSTNKLSSIRHAHQPFRNHHYEYDELANTHHSLTTMSPSALKNYFESHHYNQQDILQFIQLYQSDEFITFIKTFDGYAATVTALYKKYANASFITKFYHLLNNTYYKGFTKRLKQLNDQLKQENQNKRQQQSSESTYKITHILQNNHSYDDCAQHIEALTKSILKNNNLNNNHTDKNTTIVVENTLRELYNPLSEQHFAFNIALINHVLSDVNSSQHQKALSHSPNLFKHALITFVTNLNPITQASQWIESTITAAHFTADVLFGELYLSEEEYKTRMDGICNTLAELPWDNFSKITTEQWVEIGASFAADCVYLTGMTKIAQYLKKLETINSAHKKTSQVISKAKESLEKALSKNNYVINTDGTVIKHIPGPPHVASGITKHITYHTIEQLKNAQYVLITTVKESVASLRKKYDCTRKGFGEFANKYIKVDYEHILGIELSFSKKGAPQINGFHIDCMNNIEKSGIIEFNNKVMYKDGFYSTELLFNGKTAKRTATFFPAHWSNVQVIDAIFEAYDNFIKNKTKPILLENGVYTIKGKLINETQIIMIISPNGKIKTAYPILR